MNITEPKPQITGLKIAVYALALVSLSAATGWGAASLASEAEPSADVAKVRAALKLRLPKTPIDAIDCKGLAGLCEVASKTTLFYTDRKAKYLVIGRIYDMEARQDLTAARLLALNPDMLAAGAARTEPDKEQKGSERPSAAKNVSLAGLDPTGAIFWGPSSGPKAIIFSDFACSYCKRLTNELKAIGARVEERPISIFGKESRKLAEKVLCAIDPADALHKAYAGASFVGSVPCDTNGLDANEAFARKYGFGGTPVIVRPEDGAVLEGYRPAAELKAFLTQAAPAPAKG
jgi:thiol:disulfide interchange protein DsbC